MSTPAPDPALTSHVANLGTLKACTVGDHTYGHPDVWAYDEATPLEIGRFCAFSDRVQIILGGDHDMTGLSTYPVELFFRKNGESRDRSKGPLIIGSDVWIGHGATIMSGLTIGHGAVIGAKSVVTKDVAPYAIVSGSPAVTVGQRLPPATVELMLRLAWWDWDIEDISANSDTILQADPDRLRALIEHRNSL